MPWHDTIKKKTFFCLSAESFLEHHEMQWSDGLDLITFYWKIPGETCIMNQRATASALKPFLLVGSYSFTG